MTQETRRFIFGLIVILICSIGVALHIVMLADGTKYKTYDWVLFALCFSGLFSGGKLIHDTI